MYESSLAPDGTNGRPEPLYHIRHTWFLSVHVVFSLTSGPQLQSVVASPQLSDDFNVSFFFSFSFIKILKMFLK
jgi:hypothetical protein